MVIDFLSHGNHYCSTKIIDVKLGSEEINPVQTNCLSSSRKREVLYTHQVLCVTNDLCIKKILTNDKVIWLPESKKVPIFFTS